jgi:hypothetical protein
LPLCTCYVWGLIHLKGQMVQIIRPYFRDQ